MKNPPVEVCKSWKIFLDAIKKEARKHDNVILKSCDMPHELQLGWVLCVPREDLYDGFWEAKFYGLPVFKMAEAPEDIKQIMRDENDGSGLHPDVLISIIEEYIWEYNR